MTRRIRPIDLAAQALENNGYEVEKIAEGGGLRLTYDHNTASVEESQKLADEAEDIIETVCGREPAPKVRFPVEGGREGQMVAEAFWQ